MKKMFGQRNLVQNVNNTPVRPAPPPPAVADSKFNSHQQVSSSFPPRPSATIDSTKKKPAPPRPPPPKVGAQLKAAQSAVLFTELIQPKRQTTLLTTSSAVNNGPDLLINWESPPSSPTPGRSSSDGLSLKSFGSDSSSSLGTFASSQHHQARSESGFESESDAWGETPIISTSSYQPHAGESTNKPFSMPTIIRPNRVNTRTLPPPPITGSTHLKALEKTIYALPANGNLRTPNGSSGHLADLLDLDCSNQWSSVGDDHSPPEPTIPPPAPPALAVVEKSAPSAVALFDYVSSHPGDLNFKEGDVIQLKSQQNEEWFEGSIGSREGIFPVNFVRVVVPFDASDVPLNCETVKSELISSSPIPGVGSYRAVAMYCFEAETSQDLSLQEGDIVEVTESLGNGWLYGQDYRSGRQGQFPEAFVRPESSQ